MRTQDDLSNYIMGVVDRQTSLSTIENYDSLEFSRTSLEITGS